MTLTPYLAILEQDGLDQQIRASARNKAARFHSPAHDSLCKQFFADVVEEALPDSFLVAYAPHALELGVPAQKPETDPSFDGVYHIINDRRLCQILEAGSFRRLDEHDKGAVSTGRLERKMGLAGVYCTYKRIYKLYAWGGEDITNVVVFDRSIIYTAGTICLKTECSFTSVFGLDEELYRLGVEAGCFHNDFLEERELDSLMGKKAKDFTPDDVAQFTLHCLAHALSIIQHPDEMVYWESRCETASELVVNNPEQLLPRMILVDEEPEYFRDTQRAAQNRLSHVSVIAYRTVENAVRRIRGGPPAKLGRLTAEQERNWYYHQFVEGVNKGTIPLGKGA